MTDVDAASRWDVFIVHSSKAKARSRELYELLAADNIRAYLDAEHLVAGGQWDNDLDGALRNSLIAVILVSESFDSAFYANEEIVVAINCYRSTGAPLVIPVYLDGISPGTDAPYGLNRIQSLSVAQGESMEEVASTLRSRVRQLRAAPAAPDAPSASGARDLVVDWRGSETYRTIQQALNEATPGATIRVREGVYNESLTITKPVHVIGDGQIDKIIIQAFNSTTITLSADGGSIEGITVRQKGGTFPYQAIDIASGLPRVERCIISGGAHSSVRIRGNATPTVQRNVIVGTARHGIELGDHSSVQILDNWIEGMAEDGMWIGGKAHAVAHGNVIEDCVGAGMRVLDDARVSVDANTVRSCGDGIVFAGRSYGKVTGNHVTRSRRVGLILGDEGSGTFTGNRITRSELVQVDVSTFGGVTMEENVITGGRLHGVWVSSGAPTFARNVISDNQWDGVYSHGQAAGVFYENWIDRNTGRGFYFENCSGGEVRLNIIEGNGSDGVCVMGETSGPTLKIERNRITGNDGAGIAIMGAPVLARHNLVALNRLHGIQVAFWSGQVTLEENDVSAADENGATDDPGILVESHFAPERLEILGNRVHGCDTGILLRIEQSPAAIRIDKNFVDENAVAIAVFADEQTSGELTCTGNRMAANGAAFSLPGPELPGPWIEWPTRNVDEADLDPNAVKLRTLGFVRRLEPLDPEVGSIALDLAERARQAGLGGPPATEQPDVIVLDERRSGSA